MPSFLFFFLTFSCSSNFQQRDKIMIKLRLNVSGSTTSSCPTREIFYLQLSSGAAKEHSFRVVESTTSYKKSTVTEFFFFLISQQYSAVTPTLRMILTKIILCAHAGRGQCNAHRVIYKNAIPNIQQIKGKLHFPPPLAVSLDPSIQFS